MSRQSSPRPAVSGVQVARARGKVLVVDDDPLVLSIIRARLEGAGFDVVVREEALGTTRAILDIRPDVVLLDLNMPALSGDHLAGLLQENARSRQVPIIFHSSDDLASLQQRADSAGVLGAIAKTEKDELFIAQFERLVRRAKLPG